MDRARLWWTNRVWWQKSALIAVVVIAVGVPFLDRSDSPDQAAPGTTGAVPTATSNAGTAATQPTTTATLTDTSTTLVATTRAPERTGPPSDAEAAFVVSITDGDTVRIQYGSGGTSEPVRLIGIDAPEIGACLADAATAALSELLADFEIYLTTDVSDRDRFDRLLRYLWLEDGTLVNEAMVARGLARARQFPPDTAEADRLEDAQALARTNEAGLWAPGACPAAAPEA